jgi:prepilin-type N-terminal cleavage/methylation domain-containing protein
MQTTRGGVTLPELLIALSLIGVLLSIALPNFRSGLDALTARAARETAFALFSRARIIALENGGATMQFFTSADLLLDEGNESVTLRYDAHGLGRMMSRTLRFRTRSAIAGLTVSSFGRVRRW